MAGTVRIGVSGWTYKAWRGIFYPERLPQKNELAWCAGQFPSIEINGTFYSLQTPASFARWAAATPAEFVFAVKGPRYITHMLRGRNIDTAIANFLASALLRLGPKLGPLLWQFPPTFRFDPEGMDAFLQRLPRDTSAAVALARGHQEWLNERRWLDAAPGQPLRHAVEVRHPSFIDPAFVALLRRHAVALTCTDALAWPRLMDVTTDFIYCRLHGPQELYASGYDDEAIAAWARRVEAWSRGGEPDDASRAGPPAPSSAAGRDVYLYFDNDVKARAPADARRLIERLAAH